MTAKHVQYEDVLASVDKELDRLREHALIAEVVLTHCKRLDGHGVRKNLANTICDSLRFNSPIKPSIGSQNNIMVEWVIPRFATPDMQGAYWIRIWGTAQHPRWADRLTFLIAYDYDKAISQERVLACNGEHWDVEDNIKRLLSAKDELLTLVRRWNHLVFQLGRMRADFNVYPLTKYFSLEGPDHA